LPVGHYSNAPHVQQVEQGLPMLSVSTLENKSTKNNKKFSRIISSKTVAKRQTVYRMHVECKVMQNEMQNGMQNGMQCG
jgi:hypothetical protein